MQTTELSATSLLKERHSVRKYKTGVRIPEDVLKEVFYLASQAPSSWNLQHWKYIVIQDDAQKQKMLPVANNQQQVADCSALVVVLGDLEADKNAEKVYGAAVKAGYMPESAADTMVSHIHNAYETIDNIGLHEAIRNASLGAMQLMLAAKAKGIDSCPMGGFNPEALVEVLKVPERYIPVLLVSLGYAENPAHASARLDFDEIVVHESF